MQFTHDSRIITLIHNTHAHTHLTHIQPFGSLLGPQNSIYTFKITMQRHQAAKLKKKKTKSENIK